jgi:hypothetical protein
MEKKQLPACQRFGKEITAQVLPLVKVYKMNLPRQKSLFLDDIILLGFEKC